MKHVILFMLAAIAMSTAACKKTPKPKWDVHREYVVDGYIIGRVSKLPVAKVGLALSQRKGEYFTDAPYDYTDSNGYFRITYKPDEHNDGLYLHPRMKDYSCVFTDIMILKNIPKGRDFNAGKIYSKHYD